MKSGYKIISLAVTLMLLSLCKSNKPVINKEIGSVAVLIGKQWNLTELNGKQFKDTTSGQMPYIIFKMEDSSLAGSGGCNSLYAKFLPAEENLLSISGLSSTKMACDNMAGEMIFFEALRSVDSWILKNDTLFLRNRKMQNLAGFIHSPGK